MNIVLDQSYISFNEYALKKAVNNIEYPEVLEDKGMGDKFMDVLENGEIRTFFQPIISLIDGSILGLEALSRGPKSTALENPGILFDLARVYGKLWELEFLCRIKALEKASKDNHDHYIFINVDPDIINDEKFRKGFTKEFLKKFDINPENIVFEITEKNSVADITSFKRLIENYKDQGYKIAIDDTGSGYSGLKLITDIHPHYIKLDMSLVRDIDKDGVKYSLIKTLYNFCQVTNIKVIAEGIETENELNALIDIGIDYGQGYFIQKPTDEEIKISEGLIQHIKARNQKKSAIYHSNPSSIFVGDICRKNLVIESYYTGSKVVDIFNTNPTLSGIPVVDKDKLSGLIMKDKFFSKLGTQYGYALFANRPIIHIMDKHPLYVSYETTIEVASKLAMNRITENLYDYIVVLKDNKYYGIVTVKDLLEKTIELEVNYAKHLNPLSGLPGNVLIEQKLEELLQRTIPYTILYIDIDNFKIYNDIYGFEKGDRMLEFLSRIIYEAVQEECRFPHFIGHIGGDDFVVAVEGYDIKKLSDAIIDKFQKGINDFYSQEHLQSKFIVAKNRYGREEQYNLVTLSIAGVTNKYKTFIDVYELTEYASKIKKKCKEIWNNCCCILD